MSDLKQVDPEIFKIIQGEIGRQQENLELIASENIASRAVMEATGSVLTNKYAEGYPARRYYNGCEYVDRAEALAVERARKLFGADHANVQPHSGTQANLEVYAAVLKPGDTVLGMKLSHGGHLSHGCPVNFSGILYNFVSYGVSRDTEQIDFDQVLDQAVKHQPKLIVVGASAYPRKIDFKLFREIADRVGAYLMADIAHIAGLVVAGVHPDPVPYCDFVTTTSHKTMRGPRGGLILCRGEFAQKIDKVVFPGGQGGPLMHVIAAKAVCFKEAASPEFAACQRQTVKNAQCLAERLIQDGLRVISGGTDNHLMLVDTTTKGLTGNIVSEIMERGGITLNKNEIPFDPSPPNITSGIRIGTPTVTTRGMKEEQMIEIADFITDIINNHQDDNLISDIRKKTRDLCLRFPIYNS
ncbi:MAG: serine hydroxymethyltransferase [bacterium]